MNKKPHIDQYTLLCEQCGYVLEGLEQDGPCPECGKPIEESLPERRIGTPWQQDPEIKSLLKTWWMTLRHPIRTLDAMQWDIKRSRSLHRAQWLISGCWLVFMSILLIVYSAAHIETYHNVGLLVLVYLFFFAICVALSPLTLLISFINTTGLMLYSRRSRTRLTNPIARTIASHASVGWSILCLGGGFFFALWLVLSLHFEILSKASFILSITCVLSGFLFFEFFVILGYRKSRYANSIRDQLDLREPHETEIRRT